MTISRSRSLLPALTLLLSCLAWMAPARAESILVEGAWSRATPGQARNGAVFMALHNQGAEDDTLLRADADPIATSVEIHTHVHENNIMKMKAVDTLTLPAGATVTLMPGGLHIMLMGLKAPLHEGQGFTMTLTMQKAGTITIPVTVRAVGAPASVSQGHKPEQHVH
ncbi:copper chaperone PCu(A)C [Haematospirillum jordaniae]|uniref:Copper chaperone PCu(A)C n=1 Tax=Haematospirillum jordaniae TaxID=1549855 RepID=A0A143DDC3_9PROT|nr:copper chaperone PCu(A)C [Haematospirillum jordaniae]AMW34589.1 hypothetical protein AY555_04640 [Haematospirillum jordaniae]NKD46190.1 copper chaperone PCu(A)C [Haematospirillum jordaniae]NKD58116.1 copper chaperone PCu(A)C [Haematospirillum jordaniae]NKD60217.1 copper chaperone PCu(A)C [Haematospirillum jordaniae]NKD68141.1 copper chaperone PCu(A)C [Haematospirillum jordaniae]